jgi:hypothetical protein
MYASRNICPFRRRVADLELHKIRVMAAILTAPPTYLRLPDEPGAVLTIFRIQLRSECITRLLSSDSSLTAVLKLMMFTKSAEKASSGVTLHQITSNPLLCPQLAASLTGSLSNEMPLVLAVKH